MILPGYRIACDEPLIPNPAGTHWASPTTHVVLEGLRILDSPTRHSV